MEELWKDIHIQNVEDIYRVSNLGNIERKDFTYKEQNSGKIITKKSMKLSPIVGDKRSPRIGLLEKNTHKRLIYPIAYIVGYYFVPNNRKCLAIDYKDNNPENIKADNLKWVKPEDPEYHQIQDLPGEIWKTIEDYPYYKISNMGRIKSIARYIKRGVERYYRIIGDILMTPSLDSSGYLTTSLMDNSGHSKSYRVHRLVAIYFVNNSNKDLYDTVDHINHDRSDNRAVNLQWVSHSENSKNLSHNISIIAKFPDGNTKSYISISEASIDTGISESTIKRRAVNNTTSKKDNIYFEFEDPKIKKSKLASKNRRKGNNFELEIVHKLIECGYKGCVTSRSESKRLDNNKIDIIDTNGELDTNIQSKYLANTPNYFKIKSECSDNTKPFTIIWKKSTNDGTQSPGTIAMVDVNYFYFLLKLQHKYNEYYSK